MLDRLVRMAAGLCGLQVVNGEALGGKIGIGKSLEFAGKVGDLTAVGTPAGFAGVAGDLDSAATVAVHVVNIANLGFALALVGDEANLAAVRRRLGIELIHVGCFREVDGIG